MAMTKAALRIKEAMAQYSKKMCTRVTIFWMLYRLANFVVMLLRPEISNALADLCAGVDTIMIVNMGTYAANSSTEKVARAYAQRKSLYSSDEKKDEEDKDEDAGDDSSNG